MKKIVLLLLLPAVLFSQGLNLEKYKEFLKNSENLSPEGLLLMHPPGTYEKAVQLVPEERYFLDSTISLMNMTPGEKELLRKNGFVVSERLSYSTMYAALKDIWNKDLPIFITTDMILQAVHQSYDEILKQLEEDKLYTMVFEALKLMHSKVKDMEKYYPNSPMIKKSILDIDVYLTVALNLLYNDFDVNYSENKDFVQQIMTLINGAQMSEIALFSEHQREYDFSQFTVRGHYTQSYLLQKYFQGMIWLGRTEFYLIAPEPALTNPQSPEDIQRMFIDAVLLNELIKKTGTSDTFKEIDALLTSLIGESDNVQPKHIDELMNEAAFVSALDLVKMENITKLQDILRNKPYCDQKILSQLIWEGPTEAEKVKPASAFMMMGQRFIIDSYILGNLVDDKVEDRMLPSVLDPLFVLGNNAAADFLQTEMKKYKDYPAQLAALRYLTDTYDESFWHSSYYNTWLNSIRKLNPPDDEKRKSLPSFMRTAAWWQEKMNTQLASWAQIRHDNLLYAKQSYSSGNLCSFPHAYLEPIPEFYKEIMALADNGSKVITSDISYMGYLYFQKLFEVSEKLYNIALKERNNEDLSNAEISFLTSVFMKEGTNCDGTLILNGWFFDLLALGMIRGDKPDLVVADVHTSPTDEGGSMVGWVKHLGTGLINLLVANVETRDGNTITYCGPVMSFYEHTTCDFKRLTDEEWKSTYLNDKFSIRPPFVDLYLSDLNGNLRQPDPISLPVGVEDNKENQNSKIQFLAFPNPFSNSVNIGFSIPNYNMNEVSVRIYDIRGELVNELWKGELSSGNYIFKWDGSDMTGKAMPNGSYTVSININGLTDSGQILLSK